jgi:hypothetical protein
MRWPGRQAEELQPHDQVQATDLKHRRNVFYICRRHTEPHFKDMALAVFDSGLTLSRDSRDTSAQVQLRGVTVSWTREVRTRSGEIPGKYVNVISLNFRRKHTSFGIR